jgi:hypothetical protein
VDIASLCDTALDWSLWHVTNVSNCECNNPHKSRGHIAWCNHYAFSVHEFKLMRSPAVSPVGSFVNQCTKRFYNSLKILLFEGFRCGNSSLSSVEKFLCRFEVHNHKSVHHHHAARPLTPPTHTHAQRHRPQAQHLAPLPDFRQQHTQVMTTQHTHPSRIKAAAQQGLAAGRCALAIE